MGLTIHKAVEVISLGSTLASNGSSTRLILILLLTLSLINTLGIIIGVAITKSNKLLDVIFLSLSGGMMLHAACSGIIVKEFQKDKKY